MKDFERCCANCEWCFTIEDERYLESESKMRNGGVINQEEITSHAGDCVFGFQHDENYCCSKHIYFDDNCDEEEYMRGMNLQVDVVAKRKNESVKKLVLGKQNI